MNMSPIYSPQYGNRRSKRDFRREYELALMEACHIPRVSRNENLRAAFLHKQPDESQPQVSHNFAYKGTVQNASEASGARSSVSSPSATVHQETLDILEGLRTKQHSPLLSIPHITYDTDRPKRHARIFGELIGKADYGTETYSSGPCISVPSPLYPSHRNTSSGTVASSAGSPTSIRYLITASNPSNKYPQHTRPPGTPQTPLLEYPNASLSGTNFPNTFSILSSFDGRECAKEYVDYMKRSSTHSQWVREPDQIDHSPPTPVLRRASSWAMGRIRSGSIHVAHALGLHSGPELSADADRCYLIYCPLPSCNPGRQC